MKKKKLLKEFITFSILIFISIVICSAAHAQFTYFGPFGPYYPGPFAYGYGAVPFLPPAPIPFLGTPLVPYRSASILLNSLTTALPVTTTAPAVTPAGFSVTSLVPPPPPATISIVLPLSAITAPTVPTVTAPTVVAAPVVTTTVPGITTAILLGGGGGGSLTTLATLGLLPTASTIPTTPVLPIVTPVATVPTVATTVPGVTTALLLGGGGVSPSTLLLLGI